jgi:hypothetical protein
MGLDEEQALAPNDLEEAAQAVEHRRQHRHAGLLAHVLDDAGPILLRHQ